MSGPSKTPTRILELQGSWRAKRRLEREPRAPLGWPDPPDWLDSEGLRYWHQTADRLERSGMLSVVDEIFIEADEPSFCVKPHSMGVPHPIDDVHHELHDVICRSTGIHLDEVGVFVRHFSGSHAVTLQAGLVDQPAC